MSLILTPVTPGSLAASTQTPSTATLASYPYLVKQIPVTPDGGVANLYSVVQAFVIAQVAGTICSLAAGIYRLSADIVMPNGVSLSGAGAERTTILFDDAAGYGFTWAGPSWDVSNTLASNAATDATTVTVTSNGNQYTAGMWVYITDTDSATIGAPFVTRVVSVSTNTITLQDALPQDYTTAHTATLYGSTVGLWSGMSVQGIGFGVTSKAYGTNATARNSFIKASGLKNLLIDDCLFDGAFSEGIWVASQCHGVKIRDSRFTGCNGDGNGAQGIVIENSTRCSITGCELENNSAGIVFQHSPYPIIQANQIRYCHDSRGIKVLWGSNFGTIQGNVVSDTVLSGYHQNNCSGCAVTGNTFHKVGTADSNNAIYIGGDATSLTYLGNSVVGNTVRNVKRAGVYIDSMCPHTLVGNNTFVSTNREGAVIPTINVQPADCTIVGNNLSTYGAGAKGVSLGAAADRTLISGNHFQNGGSGKAVDTASGPGTSLVVGNLMVGETNNLHASDDARAANNYT